MPQRMTKVKLLTIRGSKVLSDGANLLSCHPDGTIGTVIHPPVGQDPSPQEQVEINGNVATFAPDDVFNFPFVLTIPGAQGWSGIYLVAL